MKKPRIWLLASVMVLSCTWMASGADLMATESDLLQPTGLTVDENSVVYVVDAGNNNVVMLEGETVDVVAGFTLPVDRYGIPAGGYNDGAVDDSLFNRPSDLIFWNDGLVVSDTENNVVRFIADGEVSTLAGTEEGLYLPTGLTTDDDGNLYVADGGNGKICKITVAGTVTTYADGFVAPYGLAWYDGLLYVSDLESHQIYTVKNGVKTLVAGANDLDEGVYVGGYLDSDVWTAQFNGPKGIFVNEEGVYVADSGNAALRLVTDGQVYTVFSVGDSGETWPIMPSDVEVYDKTIYLCDPFSGNVIALAEAGYLDIPADAWWTTGAYTMIDLEIMTGVEPQIFAPDLWVTREMAATMLYRLEGDGDATSDVAFADVDADGWYYGQIAWAVESDVMNGYDNGFFGLGDSITRQDFVAILYRYSQNCGLDMGTAGDLSAFQDGNQVAEHAMDAMTWAVEQGLIHGVDGVTLAPDSHTTRAEVAVILTRWLDLQG